MRIIRVKDYEKMSQMAADVITVQILLKPDSVLGLATGSSPEGIYGRLVTKYKQGELDFSQVTTVNLDEYRGLSGKNPQSYRYYMSEHLFNHVNIRPEAIHLPDGMEEDVEKAVQEYEEAIASVGRTDLQLLGLGANGHIGFNEPNQVFEKGVHCVNLEESTIEANSRFFESPDEVPRQAITMGIQNIMQAKRILLVVSGKGKAKAVRDTVLGPITPQVPGSILQLHQDVVLIGDEEALSLL
ncbi:MAG: glucosamine-6-phosphate deaminase [Lachnospiraceae bacterium]|nr:glucosamine-6-phosphate deaminase [Lachnospiraceae bacterium]